MTTPDNFYPMIFFAIFVILFCFFLKLAEDARRKFFKFLYLMVSTICTLIIFESILRMTVDVRVPYYSISQRMIIDCFRYMEDIMGAMGIMISLIVYSAEEIEPKPEFKIFKT